MAVAHRASTSTPYSGTDSTSFSLTIPGTVQVGDLLVFVTATRQPMTTPTGWTNKYHVISSFLELNVYYKVAVSGDIGATLTISASNSTAGRGTIALSAYSGTAGTLSTVLKTDYSGSSTILAPSQTPAATGAMLVCGNADYGPSSSGTPSVSSPLTQRVATTATWTRIALGDELLSSTAATGTRTTTVVGGGFEAYAFSFTLAADLAQTVAVGRATVTNTARPIATPQSVALGRATATTTARSITPHKSLHTVYDGPPTGTYAGYTDGTPSITLGETFYRYSAGLPVAYVVGGRVWTPSDAPSQVTISAWTDATGVRDAAFNLDTTPARSVTVTTNPGGWTVATWPGFAMPADGYRVLIGYQFGPSTTDDNYYVAATDAYPNADPKVAADGSTLAKSESFDGSSTYGPVNRGYFRYGTGTVDHNGSATTGYGVDILVSETVPSDVARATEADTARTLTPTAATTVPVGRAVAVMAAASLAVAATTSVTPGRAAEADTAAPLTVTVSGSPQSAAVGRASEADTGRATTVTPGPLAVAVGRATSSHTARPLTPTLGNLVPVGRAVTADMARALAITAGPTALAVGRATETDGASTLTLVLAQSRTLGRASSGHTAYPLGVVGGMVPASTDTGNRAGGRVRDGLGVATWEPPVVPTPASVAGVLAYDVVNAHANLHLVGGTQPTYDVTTAATPRLRTRLLVGGKDVTYFRNVVTPLPSYQLVEPLLYGPATLAFPQIAGTLERVGAGHLKWLKKGHPVVVQRVDADDNVVAVDYRGVIVAFNLDGPNLTVEVGGQATGRAALQNKQPPLWHHRQDVGYLAWEAVTHLRLHFEPRLGPATGIKLATYGGMSWLDYISDLCAKAQTRDGSQWTIMPDANGVYRMARKDTTTIHASVYLDDARAVGSLRRDIAEEPNRVYMTGVNPEGRRVRNAIYPGLNRGELVPYPMTSGDPFGAGTTDADTATGDGISTMVARLWTMKYLDLTDTPGGYDADATRAIKALQEDAGLAVTGTMNVPTWRALFDLSATGYSLRGSHIEPMAQRAAVREWNRTSSGAKLARNPSFDPGVLPVDVNVDAGVGFRASQLREWARAELSTEDNWVGTITLNTGAVIAGEHTPGTPIGTVLPARSLRPGMNIWAPLFMGGTLFHISGISVDAEGVVALSVDTRARDTMKVWEIIQRNRDSRANPARAWITDHRSSTVTKDAVGEWDVAGGVTERVALTAGSWTVFEVPAGQEGTIRSIRVALDPARAFAMAVFGRRVKASWLNHQVPDPLTAAGTKKWESPAARNRLDNRFLLYAAGTADNPCGYWPGKHKDDSGVTTDPVTGKHQDDAGVSFHTFAEPVLYVAVWVAAASAVQAGRIMWNQLETGS